MFIGKGTALGSLLLSAVILGGSRSSFPAGSGIWAAAPSLEKHWVPPSLQPSQGQPLRRGTAPAGTAGLNYCSEEPLCLYCFHLLPRGQRLFSEAAIWSHRGR